MGDEQGMAEFHAMWNLAADYGADGEAPEGTPESMRWLSYVLRFHNSSMGGGLGFAFEVNERFRVERAIAGARYLGLHELADFWADLLDHFADTGQVEPPEREARYHELVPDDRVLFEAFKAKATARTAGSDAVSGT